jgi:CRISPR/Cas system-associated exonuclease Cas4 (RecB family)
MLMRSEEDVKGRAHYMLRLNEHVRRSATERWARGRKQWSSFEGLVRVTEATRPFLESQRLGTRPYSVSALQNYAYCPYRFLLSAMVRLEPMDEPEPLQRIDPLTKGSLFHEVVAEFFRALQRRDLPIRTTSIDAVLRVLDDTLTRVAAEYAEMLAPAVDRVWQDDIASIRTDLHIWARDLASRTEWEPWLFEFAFGLPDAPGHDPNSVREPVKIDGRFILRGSVDLVERKSGANILRVIDHKTGKNRSERGSVIGHGRQLQPVIYSLAVEAATGATVESARFSYCTTAGGFTEHTVAINEQNRRAGIEALEIIDRAVELGMLPPAPAEKACAICDFLTVCGPHQERRARRKSAEQIADLMELRRRP